MRALAVTAALLTLVTGPVRAEGWFMLGPTLECRGLESLVLFGLIDGGQDGDTTEFTAIVENGDSEVCLERLESYGYPGLWNPDCAMAFDVLSTNGLPEWLAGEEVAYLTDILAPRAPDTCANMLFDLTAGQ